MNRRRFLLGLLSTVAVAPKATELLVSKGKFDGASDYIEFTHDPEFDFGGDWTIEFWYNKNTRHINEYRLSSIARWTRNFVEPESEWHHFMKTQENGKQREFINGNEVPNGWTEVVVLAGPRTLVGFDTPSTDRTDAKETTS